MLPWRAVLGPGLALLLLAAGRVQGEEPVIYKWVDQNGIAHYTTDPERVPSSLRDRIRKLPRGTEPADRETPAVGAPSESASTEWAERDAAPDRGPEAAEGAAAEPAVPASSGEGPAAETAEAGARTEAVALDEKIAALEAAIALDEERLKALISDPARTGGMGLAEDAEFREVARRLPRLQADLRALREQREGLAEPESPQP